MSEKKEQVKAPKAIEREYRTIKILQEEMKVDLNRYIRNTQEMTNLYESALLKLIKN